MNARIGISDEEFIRGKVPMTKREIRILTIARASLASEDIVCDIGAGTGSLSVEAALQVPLGHVYSIERKPEAVELIKANAEKFKVKNISVIKAQAPQGMESLPQLDCAIIGGSGSQLKPILQLLDEKLKIGGRLILNCITLQTMSQCMEWLRQHKTAYIYDAMQVQVTHWKQVGVYDMADAANPIFIVTAVKR